MCTEGHAGRRAMSGPWHRFESAWQRAWTCGSSSNHSLVGPTFVPPIRKMEPALDLSRAGTNEGAHEKDVHFVPTSCSTLLIPLGKPLAVRAAQIPLPPLSHVLPSLKKKLMEDGSIDLQREPHGNQALQLLSVTHPTYEWDGTIVLARSKLKHAYMTGLSYSDDYRSSG
jgi:hypothetical protein